VGDCLSVEERVEQSSLDLDELAVAELGAPQLGTRGVRQEKSARQE
jgi:hypothetical protein